MAKTKLTPEEQKMVFEVEVKLKVKDMTDEQLKISIYHMEKEVYKRKISTVLKDCNFNGQGMRELLTEVMDELG